MKLKLSFFGIALVIWPGMVRADSVADFYRGKQVRFIIGSDVGGGYDVYARAVARHIGTHIPGNPTIIAQNMNGGGSRVAANWIYNIGPRDGTVIGAISQSTPLDQARKQEGIRFDAAQMNWIGNPVVDNLYTTSWYGSGLTSIEDVQRKGGLICGGTGASTPGVIYPQILNNLLRTKIRVVIGYGGTGAVNLAMERGEVNCVAGYAWSSMTTLVPDWLNTHKLNLLLQWGPEKAAAAKAYQKRDVPLVTDLATSDLDRHALEIIVSGATVGRPLVVAPGVPEERVAALRRAFDQTMTDPEFLADAEHQSIDIAPIRGEKLQQKVTEVTHAQTDVLRRADELMEIRDTSNLSK